MIRFRHTPKNLSADLRGKSRKEVEGLNKVIQTGIPGILGIPGIPGIPRIPGIPGI